MVIRKCQKLFIFCAVILSSIVMYKNVLTFHRNTNVFIDNEFFIRNEFADQVTNFDNECKSSEKIHLHNDTMIPGKCTWIPYPVKRNPSGPFIIKTNNGEKIKYTNYTFYPLTFGSSFLLNNPKLCYDAENLTLLIIVHTSLHHFYRRETIRATWADPSLLKTHQSRTIFLVGRDKYNRFQEALELESAQFHDIVQGDFIDDYHNLTHKGILGYRWIVTYCENAKFVLKTDDDIFVNIFLLIDKLLLKYADKPRTISCRILINEPIARNGKYAVDSDYFPSYQRYPLNYCAGPFVLMPRNIVPEMYEAAKYTPFYWIDDLYLFGILPNQIQDVSFRFVADVHNNEELALHCFHSEQPCKYLAAYAWRKGVMYKYWLALLVMHKDLVQKYAVNV